YTLFSLTYPSTTDSHTLSLHDALPILIEAHVGDDAVEPGVEAAFEAEAMQVAVNLEEGLLIDVARVFRPLHQVQGQAQHVAVEAANQFLESDTVAGLRFRHQCALVEISQRGHRGQGGIAAAPATIFIGHG